jgi:hypothetical protein
MSVISLTVTYLLQVYNALYRRIQPASDSTWLQLKPGCRGNRHRAHLKTLVGALGYKVEEIDVAATRPEAVEQRPPVQARLRSAG